MISEILIALADFLWGTPMTVVLVGTGLYLSIRFRFYYNFRKIAFNWKNTYGRMFRKSEGAGTISGIRRTRRAVLDVDLQPAGHVHQGL